MAKLSVWHREMVLGSYDLSRVTRQNVNILLVPSVPEEHALAPRDAS